MPNLRKRISAITLKTRKVKRQPHVLVISADPKKKKAACRASYNATPEKKRAASRASYKPDPELPELSSVIDAVLFVALHFSILFWLELQGTLQYA